MNVAEVADLFWGAMGCDSRLKELDDRQLVIWSRILRDVPRGEGAAIVAKLYAKPKMIPLQPGDVLQGWEELQEDRADAAREAARDCPVHEGQKLPYCRSCRADVLVGARRRDQIGVIL